MGNNKRTSITKYILVISVTFTNLLFLSIFQYDYG